MENQNKDAIAPKTKESYWIRGMYDKKAEYKSILSAMDENKILFINKLENNRFELLELGDECFAIELTAPQLRDLGLELIAIADEAQK